MRSILIVEPEMLIGLILADFLQECGFQAFHVHSGSEAASLLKRSLSVDAVVTDLAVAHPAEGLSLVLWISEHQPDLRVFLATSDVTKIGSVMNLHAMWGERRVPYDLTAAVSQMRSIVNGRQRREDRLLQTMGNPRKKPFVSEYLLKHKRSFQEVCLEQGRCPDAPPDGYCKECPRAEQERSGL